MALVPLSGGQVPWLPASAAAWVPAVSSDQPRLDRSGCTVATGRCPPSEKGILWQGSDCYGLPPGSGPSSTGPGTERCLELGNWASCWKKRKMGEIRDLKEMGVNAPSLQGKVRDGTWWHGECVRMFEWAKMAAWAHKSAMTLDELYIKCRVYQV